jgi:hypothetical protein
MEKNLKREQEREREREKENDRNQAILNEKKNKQK